MTLPLWGMPTLARRMVAVFGTVPVQHPRSLLLAAAIGLTLLGPSTVRAGPVASTATDLPSAVPASLTFSRIEGSGPQYVASEIVREVGRRSGVTIDVVALPAARARRHTIDGLTDGEVGRIRLFFVQNPQMHQVSPPIMSSTAVAIASRKIDAPEDRMRVGDTLKTYRIGIVRGVMQSAQAAQGASHVEVVGTPRQLYRMLAAGHIDFAIDFRLNAERFSRELGVAFSPIDSLSEESMYIGLQRKHADLAPRFSSALVSMSEDGSLKRISQESANQYVLGLVE
jgi:ABC-type amino acid transport substrate-binding protein